MNEQEQFIRRHKDSEFHYKDELFAGLSSGACFLKRGPAERQASLPCSHFLIIYRHRAEHLQRFDTPHARRVREDIIAFCDELAKTPDELCLLWMFSMPPNREYMVFEGAESGRVLGCILVANKLLTPPDEWERLWQGESDSV